MGKVTANVGSGERWVMLALFLKSSSECGLGPLGRFSFVLGFKATEAPTPGTRASDGLTVVGACGCGGCYPHSATVTAGLRVISEPARALESFPPSGERPSVGCLFWKHAFPGCGVALLPLCPTVSGTSECLSSDPVQHICFVFLNYTLGFERRVYLRAVIGNNTENSVCPVLSLPSQ